MLPRMSLSTLSRFAVVPCWAHSRAYSTVLDSLVNWEQRGIPNTAGSADSNDFDVARMRRLLQRLGDPHLKWPAVHIAGSKGKGSTAALITEMLRSSGRKVGLYTSPHMSHISERISTSSGSHMQPSDFDALAAAHEQQIAEFSKQEQGALSHFEAVTALAFRHFADEQVDIAVIETGMGGLTDATNAITAANLQLAVITALGLEHAAALGGSLQSIAAAKSGIMKPGRPVVVSRQEHPEALQVVLQHAAAAGCEVLQADELVSVQRTGLSIRPGGLPSAAREEIEATGRGGVAAALSCRASASLVGPHQRSNIATAVTAACQLRAQGWAISDDDISMGIGRAHLPGRFQVLGLRSEAASTATSKYVVLDGAHTRASAAALRATLGAVFPDLPVVMVVAMAADKDHHGVIEELRGCAPKVVVFTSASIAGSTSRSCAPGVLAAQWQTSAMMTPGPRCRQLIQASLPAAIEKAMHELSAFSGPGIICVAGSLHAAAQAGKFLREQVAHRLAV